MAQEFEGLRIALGQDRHGGVRVDRAVEVPDGAVHPGGERRARQARADPFGELARRCAPRHLAHAAVRERQPDLLAHWPSWAGGGAGGSLLGAKAK